MGNWADVFILVLELKTFVELESSFKVDNDHMPKLSQNDHMPMLSQFQSSAINSLFEESLSWRTITHPPN